MYLVIGRPAGGFAGLTEALREKEYAWEAVGDELDAPVGVYQYVRRPPGDAESGAVGPDAIFVFCHEASVWGAFCGAADGGGTSAPRIAPTRAAGTTTLQGTPRHDPLDEGDRARAVAAFRCLCDLIRESRYPECPVNGVLVVVPWAVIGTDAHTDGAAAALLGDLSTAHAVFRFRCPTVALVADLDTAPGFRDFVRCLPDRRDNRFGSRFPLAPQLGPQEVRERIAHLARWLGSTYVWKWVIESGAWDVVVSDPSAPADSVAATRRLFRFHRAVVEGTRRLAVLLARGLPLHGGTDDRAGSPWLGGVYLAGTGADATRRAFGPGVIDKLIREGGHGEWDPAAVAEVCALRRRAVVWYAVIAAAVCGLAALLGLLIGTHASGAP